MSGLGAALAIDTNMHARCCACSLHSFPLAHLVSIPLCALLTAPTAWALPT